MRPGTGEWRGWALAALLVALFVGLRAALLWTSLDANTNREEPVFAFSAGELARGASGSLFDHQDDLRHGAGLALVAVGVPWFALFGGDLLTFKLLALLVSGLVLGAHVWVGWRYFSPTVGLLWGVLYVSASGVLARLQVTLVGSHPESLLPTAAALAAYLELVRREHAAAGRRRIVTGAFGLACGVSVWSAYIALVFVAPLVGCWLWTRPRPAALAGFGSGAALGVLPWAIQNLWLRPHGSAFRLPPGEPWLWSGLVSAFGSGDAEALRVFDPRGFALLVAAAGLWLALLRSVWRTRRAEGLAFAPFLVAAPLGLLLFAAVQPPFHVWDGYYNLRYLAPILAALFWVLALGLDRFWPAAQRRWLAVVAVAFLAHGVWAQTSLLGRGRTQDTSWAKTRLRGCDIYGRAEVRRSPDVETARARLAALEGEECRELALLGFERALKNQRRRRAEWEARRGEVR